MFYKLLAEVLQVRRAPQVNLPINGSVEDFKVDFTRYFFEIHLKTTACLTPPSGEIPAAISDFLKNPQHDCANVRFRSHDLRELMELMEQA